MAEETTLQTSREPNSDLVLLSDQPVSRWLNLLNMDVIRMRNKPQEAVKKPKAAPFFLPTIQGLEFKFQVEDNANDKVRVRPSSLRSFNDPTRKL